MNLPVNPDMPVITMLYAGLLAVFYTILAARVIWLRNVEQVGIGAGESKRLARAIRVHGNAAENLPFALLLLLLLELAHVDAWLLHGCGTALLVGRLLHAWGLYGRAGYSVGRIAGMGITLLTILTLALSALLQVFA